MSHPRILDNASPLTRAGHGIGGSVAFIAALELMETAVPRSWSDCQTYLETGQIESSGMPNFVFTFGSPSVGDETFCSALDSSFCRWQTRKKPGMHREDYERNLRVLRFVKPCDLAPSIPGCLSIACELLGVLTSALVTRRAPAQSDHAQNDLGVSF